MKPGTSGFTTLMSGKIELRLRVLFLHNMKLAVKHRVEGSHG